LFAYVQGSFSQFVCSLQSFVQFIQWNCLFSKIVCSFKESLNQLATSHHIVQKLSKNTFCAFSQKACKICNLFEMFKIFEIPFRKYAGPCTNQHLLLWDIYCNDNTIKKKINDNTIKKKINDNTKKKKINDNTKKKKINDNTKKKKLKVNTKKSK